MQSWWVCMKAKVRQCCVTESFQATWQQILQNSRSGWRDMEMGWKEKCCEFLNLRCTIAIVIQFLCLPSDKTALSNLKVWLMLKVSLVRVTPSGQTSFYIYTSFYSRSEAWKHGQIERERCMICKTLLLPLFPYVGHQPICAQTLPAKLVSSFPVLRLNIFSRTAFVCVRRETHHHLSLFTNAPLLLLQMPALGIERRHLKNLVK